MLTQQILRNKYGDMPRFDSVDNEWENAKVIIEFSEQYWLHNRIREKQDITDIDCVHLTVEELYNILEDSKTCVNERNEDCVKRLFGIDFKDSFEFHYCIEGMKNFNKIMANALRNKKHREYFYHPQYCG